MREKRERGDVRRHVESPGLIHAHEDKGDHGRTYDRTEEAESEECEEDEQRKRPSRPKGVDAGWFQPLVDGRRRVGLRLRLGLGLGARVGMQM